MKLLTRNFRSSFSFAISTQFEFSRPFHISGIPANLKSADDFRYRFCWNLKTRTDLLVLNLSHLQITPRLLSFSDSRLIPFLRLLPNYSLFSDYSHSQTTPRLLSFLDDSQTTPYSQITPRLLPLLRLFPDDSQRTP